MEIPSEEKQKRHMKALQLDARLVLVLSNSIITMAGSADAQVGEVGGQATRAVGRAEGGEGHSVLGVQRSGEWRRELDVGQIRK